MTGMFSKEKYNEAFFYLAERTSIDFAVNLEYEYGVYEVFSEAYKLGFGA